VERRDITEHLMWLFIVNKVIIDDLKEKVFFVTLELEMEVPKRQQEVLRQYKLLDWNVIQFTERMCQVPRFLFFT
jgi:hypothetical protein